MSVRRMVTARRVSGLVAVAVGVLSLVTWSALEGNEVVVLRTYNPEGEAFGSRVWVVDDSADVIWIEAANETKPLFVRLVGEPRVELQRNGRWFALRATPVLNADSHVELRRMLAAKYGWRDRWIGHLVDTSASIAVRLDPR
jgi:hypothetical protein